MAKRPIEDRVAEFVLANPSAKHIPIHPDDVKKALLLDLATQYGMPLKVVGGDMIHPNED